MTPEQKAIKRLRQWIESPISFGNPSKAWAKGYKAGLEQAKVVVADILDESNVSKTHMTT